MTSEYCLADEGLGGGLLGASSLVKALLLTTTASVSNVFHVDVLLSPHELPKAGRWRRGLA